MIILFRFFLPVFGFSLSHISVPDISIPLVIQVVTGILLSFSVVFRAFEGRVFIEN